MDEYKFAFASRFEDILFDAFGSEVGDAEFFLHLTLQGLFHILAQVNMTADCSIPLVGLDVFPRGALLEVEVALGVEDMEVDNGMEQFAAVVTFASCSGRDDISLFVNNREHLFVIIFGSCYHAIGAKR